MGEMTKNAKNTTHSERKHTPLPWHQGGEVREELMSPDTIFGADGAAIAKFYGISLHRTLAELDPKMCADGLGNIATVVEAVNGYVALERENAGLRAALEVIELAIRDDRGETYWPARKFLDDRGIFNGDLNDLRVVHAVAKFALGAEQALGAPGEEDV